MEPLGDPPQREEALAGGNVSTVSKVGDTVRRGTGPWTLAVHALLRHLERVGFDGAPRVLGTDELGREILSYVPGLTPDRASLEAVTERTLAEVGRLLRRYHEAARGFVLPEGVSWHHQGLPGPNAVACHNDVSPRNTVFRGGLPVAFLDWHLAAPALPAWDLAHVAWQFVPVSGDAGCIRDGWASPPDRARRLRVLCDGYGLPERDRAGFAGLVARRMEPHHSVGHRGPHSRRIPGLRAPRPRGRPDARARRQSVGRAQRRPAGRGAPRERAGRLTVMVWLV